MKRKESWNRKSDLGEHRFFIFVLALKGVVARCERGRRKVQKPFGSHAEHGIRIHDRLRVVKKVFQKKTKPIHGVTRIWVLCLISVPKVFGSLKFLPTDDFPNSGGI